MLWCTFRVLVGRRRDALLKPTALRRPNELNKTGGAIGFPTTYAAALRESRLVFRRAKTSDSCPWGVRRRFDWTVDGYVRWHATRETEQAVEERLLLRINPNSNLSAGRPLPCSEVHGSGHARSQMFVWSSISCRHIPYGICIYQLAVPPILYLNFRANESLRGCRSELAPVDTGDLVDQGRSAAHSSALVGLTLTGLNYGVLDDLTHGCTSKKTNIGYFCGTNICEEKDALYLRVYDVATQLGA
ncbi:hypothetical protein CC80DRAFT_501672 [Byssothecium circinans]|uniref:Uncharacterized protein n=1 Tax=Byssothecium circinans TaxID=147558 RepID=A0A6A5U6G6_9PLEO|nr:hypothetical protein CC80DRAFT_501672 [Byssothecium circinans]